MKAGVIHHIHQRKRKHLEKQKYPHPNKKIRFLDDLIMVIAVVFPLTTLPQIFEIWVNKNAEIISLFTWSSWLVFSIPLIIYGIVHKEKPIIVMYSLWILMHSLVIIGKIIYG